MSRRLALRFVVLLGLVSLFADVTYEGARSVAGPFLGSLGAGAAAVAVVAGMGEFLGYAVRLGAGYVTDRSARPWLLAGGGYLLNLLAVPLLSMVWRWEAGAALLVAERLGKAVRTPARNVMLSHAAARVGYGWGFGLHEALDQVGAVAGPLLVGLILAAGFGYRAAFAALLLPALAALVTLLLARRLYPVPRLLEEAGPPGDDGAAAARPGGGRLPRSFWMYAAGGAVLAAGFADYPLLAYHLSGEGWSPPVVASLYALAMGADALASLVLGRAFDRLGGAALAAGFLLSSLAAPLVFLLGGAAAVAGVLLWGVGAGVQDSVLLAAVAPLVPAGRRGTAYGIFNMLFGAGWFAGSAAVGFLYARSPALAAAASAALHLAALPPVLLATRRGAG